MPADPDRLAEVADLAVARKRKRQADAEAAEVTHHQLAMMWRDANTIGTHAPVYAAGAFHVPTSSGLWRALSPEAVTLSVARLLDGRRRCNTAGDYASVARHAAALCEAADFFEHAPPGIATPAGFHRLTDDAVVTCAPLTLDHRQTFALPFAPDFDAEATRIDGVLSQAFAGDHEAEQVALWWEAAGAAVFGLMPKLQLVLLLLGRERSGKSLLQRLLERIFPPEAVSAVSPASWGHEYHVAALAGKRLNVVGELDDSQALPAGAFKNVTGQNLINGRHPTHRPFAFRCMAAQVFASNVLPPTTDRSDAFYRRWRVLRFANTVPPDRVDPDLFDKIVAAEMPAILAQACLGAERVAAAGTVRTSPAHDAVLAKWRAAANPVLQFLLDTDAVELDPQAAEHSTADVFRAYRRWAAEAGFRHAFGRNHFLDLLEATGATRGVVMRRVERADGRVTVVAGVRLLGGGLP